MASRETIRTAGKRTAGCAALLAVTLTGFEGVRQNAYQDVVGVWTVCAGETQGVKAGDHFTLAECRYKLQDRLTRDYIPPIETCLPGLPDARFIAFVSLGYNIGTQRACQSKAARLVRAGRIREGCEAFMQWSKAKGITFPGLVRRRSEERALCLQGGLE